MAEYIEREAAKRHLNQDYAYAAAELLDEIEAADVAPVVHAKWIICSDGYYPYCSNCREEPKGGMSNYCPHCGAKMDLK